MQSSSFDARAQWLREAKWGVMCHYLAHKALDQEPESLTAESWNRLVDDFDVEGLVEQLASARVGYFLLTIGQNSGHFCAPNATYDALTEITPSKCSRRDLVSDLADALKRKGIRLLVYLSSGAPYDDPIAVEKFGWQWGFESFESSVRTGKRLVEFQLKWEKVICDWSLRWGDKVSGWWFDGCYFSDEMYNYAEAPNYASFAAAARAGNPNSIVAFNPGIIITLLSAEEDYTAGETDDPLDVVCGGPCVTNSQGHQGQFHMLSYLGKWWLHGPPRFSDEQAVAMTRGIVEPGGAVTWDVPIEPSGLIPSPFIEQLQSIGKALGR